MINAIKFSELAPETTLTEERVNLFLRISESERTFGNKHSETISATTIQDSGSSITGVKRSASPFMLDDIDSMLVTKAVKKEGSSAPLPRSNPPTTRGKTSAKKKKKPSDSTEPNLLADAVAHELHKFANQSIDLLLKSYEDLVKENADLLQRVADFKHAEDTQRNLLKEKLQDLNQVNKKLHTIESKHAQEMEDVMAQAKRSAALTVYHARIKMAKEVNDPGFDRAKWDVEAWKKLVADLQDEPEDEEVGVSGVDKSIEEEDTGEKVAVQGGGEGVEKA